MVIVPSSPCTAWLVPRPPAPAAASAPCAAPVGPIAGAPAPGGPSRARLARTSVETRFGDRAPGGTGVPGGPGAVVG